MKKAKTHQFKDTVHPENAERFLPNLRNHFSGSMAPDSKELNNRPHNRPSHCPLMYNTEYHQNHKQFRTELSFPAEPICSPTYLLGFTLPFTLTLGQNSTELQILDQI
jgi:hypothetical protein